MRGWRESEGDRRGGGREEEGWVGERLRLTQEMKVRSLAMNVFGSMCSSVPVGSWKQQHPSPSEVIVCPHTSTHFAAQGLYAPCADRNVHFWH